MKFHVDLGTTLQKSFSKRMYIVDSLPLHDSSFFLVYKLDKNTMRVDVITKDS